MHQSYKNSTIVDDHRNVSNRVMGYTKPIYPVLVGNSVKIFPTNLFGLLPQHDKFLVKERLHDPTVGYARAKLVLRSSATEAKHNIGYRLVAILYIYSIYYDVIGYAINSCNIGTSALPDMYTRCARVRYVTTVM